MESHYKNIRFAEINAAKYYPTTNLKSTDATLYNYFYNANGPRPALTAYPVLFVFKNGVSKSQKKKKQLKFSFRLSLY